jgi:hypothetical protein
MKIVCICAGGACRSVHMAWSLKQLGHAAFPIGLDHSGEGLLEMACEWADKIVVMQPYMKSMIPFDARSKVSICDVGPDRYFPGWSSDLLEQTDAFAEEQFGENEEDGIT